MEKICCWVTQSALPNASAKKLFCIKLKACHKTKTFKFHPRKLQWYHQSRHFKEMLARFLGNENGMKMGKLEKERGLVEFHCRVKHKYFKEHIFWGYLLTLVMCFYIFIYNYSFFGSQTKTSSLHYSRHFWGHFKDFSANYLKFQMK